MRYYLSLLLLVPSISVVGQSLMNEVVQNELDTTWMHNQGMYGYNIFQMGKDLYCILLLEGAQINVLVSSINGSEIDKVRVWRSAEQASSNAFIYLNIRHKLSEAAWGASSKGNTIEEVVVIDLLKAEVVFSFAPYWHVSGSGSGLEYEGIWNCHYRTSYSLCGDSIFIDKIEILAAEIWDKGPPIDRRDSLESRVDPNCHPKLKEGLYLYDGNTFIRQVVKEIDK